MSDIKYVLENVLKNVSVNDNKIILKCNKCNGSGTCWVEEDNYKHHHLKKCEVCNGVGTVCIDDPTISICAMKSYVNVLEDVKKICNLWKILTEQAVWRQRQAKKKCNIEAYERDDYTLEIKFGGEIYCYDTGNETFDNFTNSDKYLFDGKDKVYIDYENYEHYMTYIPQNVKDFADYIIGISEYVYGGMSDYADTLGYYFEWEDCSCYYLGDAYKIEMSCYNTDINNVEIEYIFESCVTVTDLLKEIHAGNLRDR